MSSSSSSERSNEEEEKKKKQLLPVIDLGQLLGQSVGRPDESNDSCSIRPSSSETSLNRNDERKLEAKRESSSTLKRKDLHSEKQASEESRVAKVSPPISLNSTEKLGETNYKMSNQREATCNETKAVSQSKQHQELCLSDSSHHDEMTLAEWRALILGQEEESISDTLHTAPDSAGAATNDGSETTEGFNASKRSNTTSLSDAEGVAPAPSREGAAAHNEGESQNAESPAVATKRKRSSVLPAAT